jgi:hypothetical protein
MVGLSIISTTNFRVSNAANPALWRRSSRPILVLLNPRRAAFWIAREIRGWTGAFVANERIVNGENVRLFVGVCGWSRLFVVALQ